MAGMWVRAVLFPCVTTWLLSELSSGQANQEPCQLTHVGNTKCCDATCPKGTQPKCFEGTPPTSSCEPCPDEMFADFETDPYRRCKLKLKCGLVSNMIYIDRGNSTTNAECGCKDGYYYNPGHKICTPIVTPSNSIPRTTANPGNISESPMDDGDAETNTSWVTPVVIVIVVLVVGSLLTLVIYKTCRQRCSRDQRGKYGPTQDKEQESTAQPNQDQEMQEREPLRYCLSKSNQIILEKLHVTEIMLGKLMDKGIISKEEKQQIASIVVATEKASKLKGIVEMRGEEKIKIFLDILKEEHHDALVSGLTKNLPEGVY